METLKTYKNLKITYGELREVLKKLKYKENKTDNSIIYKNKKYDSVILLAKKRKNALVFPPDFASATYTMYHKGVIKKKEDLPNMILKERRLKKKAKTAA